MSPTTGRTKTLRTHRNAIKIINQAVRGGQSIYPQAMPDRSPRVVYREIIDALVGRAESISERLLRDEGIYSRAPDDWQLNEFARSLTSEQRELLAGICRAERVSAIHDALAELSWWVDCEDVTLAVGGVQVPVDESGMGLHGDFIGRLDDWPWPDPGPGH